MNAGLHGPNKQSFLMLSAHHAVQQDKLQRLPCLTVVPLPNKLDVQMSHQHLAVALSKTCSQVQHDASQEQLAIAAANKRSTSALMQWGPVASPRLPSTSARVRQSTYTADNWCWLPMLQQRVM